MPAPRRPATTLETETIVLFISVQRPFQALTNLTNHTIFEVALHRSRRVAKSVNIYEAKTHLSELVDRASAGEEIVIAKSGVPTARLVPLRAVHEHRAPGGWAGIITIADDFDAPLSGDILDAFEGSVD